LTTTTTDREQVVERARRLVGINRALGALPSLHPPDPSAPHWWARDLPALADLLCTVERDPSDPGYAGWQLSDLLWDVDAEECESPLHWMLWPDLRPHIDPLAGRGESERLRLLADAEERRGDPGWRAAWLDDLSPTVDSLVAGWILDRVTPAIDLGAHVAVIGSANVLDSE
jgi:hypothetical protein